MRTAIDTNVLLDLLAGDDTAIAAAREAMTVALGGGSLVICPVVYAELAANFPDSGLLARFLGDLEIQVDGFSTNALVQAGGAWRQYARERGTEVQCARCGHRTKALCPNCGATLTWRQHVIADFLVGGHAAVQADRLITRDPRYYRRYFPSVAVGSP